MQVLLKSQKFKSWFLIWVSEVFGTVKLFPQYCPYRISSQNKFSKSCQCPCILYAVQCAYFGDSVRVPKILQNINKTIGVKIATNFSDNLLEDHDLECHPSSSNFSLNSFRGWASYVWSWKGFSTFYQVNQLKMLNMLNEKIKCSIARHYILALTLEQIEGNFLNWQLLTGSKE